MFRVDTPDHGEKFFEWKEDAENWVNKVREELHKTYCVEKQTPTEGNCICTRPDLPGYFKGIECTLHYYARTVEPHTIEGCVIADNVYIEEVALE